MDERASPYAQQGTDCHELCAYPVEKALGREAEDPTENLDYFDQEMQDCAEGYCSYVMEQVEEARYQPYESHHRTGNQMVLRKCLG